MYQLYDWHKITDHDNLKIHSHFPDIIVAGYSSQLFLKSCFTKIKFSHFTFMPRNVASLKNFFTSLLCRKKICWLRWKTWTSSINVAKKKSLSNPTDLFFSVEHDEISKPFEDDGWSHDVISLRETKLIKKHIYHIVGTFDTSFNSVFVAVFSKHNENRAQN